MEIKDIISITGTLFAIVLGLYNFWVVRQGSKVLLKVTPKSSIYMGYDSSTGREFYKSSEIEFKLSSGVDERNTLAIEVVNVSKFSVTVEEVGLKSRWNKERMAIPSPILRDDGKWPRRLDSRESVTVHALLPQFINNPKFASVTHAYAITSCGNTSFGKTLALRDIVKKLSTRA